MSLLHAKETWVASIGWVLGYSLLHYRALTGNGNGSGWGDIASRGDGLEFFWDFDGYGDGSHGNLAGGGYSKEDKWVR